MAKSLASARATTLVRLRLSDGTEGVGECWGMPAVNLAMLPLVKGYLLSSHVLDVEHVFSQMLARHYHFGVQGAMTWCISGIDMAAKDAAGKVLGLPVHRLIGGKQASQVPIYASGGYLTEDSERDFAPQIEAMAKAGHRAIKIKIGISPANDEQRVAAAREIPGPKSKSWSTSTPTTRWTSPATASRALSAMASAGSRSRSRRKTSPATRRFIAGARFRSRPARLSTRPSISSV